MPLQITTKLNAFFSYSPLLRYHKQTPIPRMLTNTLLVSILGTGLSACSQVTPLTSPAATSTPHSSAISNIHTAKSDSRHEYMLDNGLKVIIKEDHRAPVVTSQVWYRLGSTDEPVDKGGISHLLEHLMFQGTPKVSGDDFDAVVEKFGGNLNAFTSHDYTGYYETLPANRLGLALELEADRMTNLLFDEAKFRKEHEVVMEERRLRVDDDPLGKAEETFRKQVLPDSPRGESVIGPMPEIASITLDELRDWYKLWYAPNNATLVIVGDVNPDDAIKQVKHYFGNIEKSSLPPRPSVSQSAFRGYESTVMSASVNVPVVMLGFTLPTLNSVKNEPSSNTSRHASEDTIYALMLLTSVLDNGYSDRLESRLVRGQEILANVQSGYDAFVRGDTWLRIAASPREGVSLEAAEKAIFNEIELLKTAPITEEEIQRAKTKVLTSQIYAQDSISGQASLIGSLQSSGLDDRILDNLPEKLDGISAEFMQEVAKKYLSKDNLQVMQVVPDAKTSKK